MAVLVGINLTAESCGRTDSVLLGQRRIVAGRLQEVARE